MITKIPVRDIRVGDVYDDETRHGVFKRSLVVLSVENRNNDTVCITYKISSNVNSSQGVYHSDDNWLKWKLIKRAENDIYEQLFKLFS